MNEILVSILCMTYNQEQYIKDALDSFLAQKIDFKFEVIVHDDASTDNTAEIIRSYERLYPEIVRGIYEKENQYSRNVQLGFAIIQDVCQGKYVAICEGDDYWIDIHKLQMQIDYMEEHPDYVLTVHDAIRIDLKNSEIKAMRPYQHDGDLLPEELIIQKHGILPTASMVFKREAVKSNTDDFWMKAGHVGDYPLQLLLLTRGKVYYFHHVMSAYRYMHQESWSRKINNELKHFIIHTIQMIHFLEEYNNYTNNIYMKSIQNRILKFKKGVFLKYQQISPWGKFKKDLEQYDEETNFLYHDDFLRLKEDFSQIFGKGELCRDIIDFCSEHRYIYIMGTGKFSDIIVKQINYNNIKISGFVVSCGEKKENIHMEKPVLELEELDSNLKDIGIVIGLNIRKWEGIIDTLERTGVKNYLVPSILNSLIKLEDI